SCGDAVIEGTERCDDGVNDIGGTGPLGCFPGCIIGPATCGDSTPVAPEICDDGINTGGEGLCWFCFTIQSCGDALIQGTEGCDDGVNNGSGPLGCLPACVLP
ncbi:MAG: hypothetical protein OES69_13255, partial [Myxococcales bacterium]|nr:hypothetical protein [Myxococcales bacterium]